MTPAAICTCMLWVWDLTPKSLFSWGKGMPCNTMCHSSLDVKWHLLSRGRECDRQTDRAAEKRVAVDGIAFAARSGSV